MWLMQEKSEPEVVPNHSRRLTRHGWHNGSTFTHPDVYNRQNAHSAALATFDALRSVLSNLMNFHKIRKMKMKKQMNAIFNSQKLISSETTIISHCIPSRV
jgi:hypothetical protein